MRFTSLSLIPLIACTTLDATRTKSSVRTEPDDMVPEVGGGLSHEGNVTIWFYGDSLSKGYGLKDFDNPAVPAHVEKITNLLLEASGVKDVRMAIASDQDPIHMWGGVTEGAILPDDYVLFENAGPHFNDTSVYESLLQLVVFTSTHGRSGELVRDPKRTLLTTMFDYDPDSRYGNSRYGEKLASGESINDTIKRVAREQSTSLIDWDSDMDSVVGVLPEIHFVHGDGIHPTVWGNIVMSVSVIKALGIEITSVSELALEIQKSMPLMVEQKQNDEMDLNEIESVLWTIVNN